MPFSTRPLMCPAIQATRCGKGRRSAAIGPAGGAQGRRMAFDCLRQMMYGPDCHVLPGRCSIDTGLAFGPTAAPVPTSLTATHSRRVVGVHGDSETKF